MDQELKDLQTAIIEATKKANQLAFYISRGTAGREIALVVTKLEEAQLWLWQADTVIEKASAKYKIE